MAPHRILAAACLFLLPCSAQRLLTGRFFGGSGSDQPAAIAADAQGNLYVTGTTTSADLPASQGFQPKPAVLPLSSSTDGGATFTGSTVPGASEVDSLAASADGKIVYAGTPAGLLRSSDGGNTWSPAAPGIPVLPQVLAVSPLDSNVVYAGAKTGFYRSTDGGNNWTLIPSQMSQYQTAIFYQILIDPLQPATLWVVAANTPQPTGIFTSSDGGSTWQAVVIPSTGFGIYSVATSIALDPTHSGTVFAGGQSIPIVKSTDGGQTWSALAPVFGTVTLNPANPSTIYSLTGFALEKSTDGGNTFVKAPLDATGLTTLLIDPANPSRLYASSYQSLFTSGDGGATWTQTPIRSVSQMLLLPGRLLVGAQLPPQVYLAKFSPDLSQLLWATYLGGAGYHSVAGLAVDPSGNAYVAGFTSALDFPVTPGALQTSGTIFVSKISADGTQLLKSTYFGNSGSFANAIAVDRSGAVYLAGTQSGTGFATTPGAFQTALPVKCSRPPDPGGFQPSNSGAAFVSRISADFSTLVYSTYLSGSCGSSIFATHVDDSGVATVAGGTYSLDFPTTRGAMAATPPGSDESGFLSQLSADGASLIYSTFLGGGPTTEAHAFLTDSAGNWVVTGGGSPASTPGAAHVTVNAGCPTSFSLAPPIPRAPNTGEDAFVMAFNAHSASPLFTATVGGSCLDEGDSIALDAAGNIWIAGLTQSSDLPTQALVGGLGGRNGGFLAAFTPTGDRLLSSANGGAMPRLVSVTGRVEAAAGTYRKINLAGQYAFSTALAAFDAVSAPPVQLDSVNAYSGSGPLFALAPGQVILLAGRHFGPSQTQPGAVAGGTVATSIAGLQVTFDGVPAPLLTLQDQSIALVVPFEVQNYYTVVQVTLNGQPVSNPAAFPVSNLSADVLLVLNADGTVNSAQHPAPVGATIGVFVTGLGVETPPVPDGQVAAAASSSPPVLVGPGVQIGQTPVQPSYVGAAIGLVAGIVQVNIPVPQVGGKVFLQARQFAVFVYVSP